jgi:hypothetical protein
MDRWTDILAALAAAAAVVYAASEIARRRRKLQELFYILSGEDATLTMDLENLVQSRALHPFTAVSKH